MRAALLGALAALSACAAVPDVTTQPIPSTQYETQLVEGWTVRVNRILLRQEAELGAEALKLLAAKLYDVSRAVPPKPLLELRKVPIWLGVDDGPNDRAQYHPSREWLTEHQFNPDKVKGVEIGNARRFLKTAKEQPSMVLHELAHAYHDQVLGFQNAEILEAYREAKKAGRYESVLRISGLQERHYAMSAPQEYFAEGTEAYLGTNDFYPFVRPELKAHDPKLHRLLEEIWK